MRRLMTFWLTGALCLAFSSPDLTACGDKSLRPGFSATLAYAPMYPASILVYATSDADFRAATTEQANLMKRGRHQVQVAKGQAGLRHALAAGKYDLVYVKWQDVPAVKAITDGAPTRPDVLFVTPRNTSQATLDQLEREFGHFVNGKTDVLNDVLREIDHMMQVRRASLPPL